MFRQHNAHNRCRKISAGRRGRTVAHSSDQLVESAQPSYVDFTRRGGFQHGAARFHQMTAIAEAAMAEVGAEFNEGMGDVLLVDVGQAEFLQAGRVDDVAVFVEMVQARMGGGVLAGIQRLGNLARVPAPPAAAR